MFTGHLTDFKPFATLYPKPEDWINELVGDGRDESNFVVYHDKNNYKFQESLGMLEGVLPYDYDHTEHAVYSFPINK